MRRKPPIPLSVPVISAPKAPKEKYPLLDEVALIKSISNEISPDTQDKIRGGTVLSILDAFDRRVSRQMFLSILSNSLQLYDWLGGLETVQRIGSLHKKQKLTEEALAEATAEYSSRSDAARLFLLALMKGLVDCAPSDATLH